ncbi:hypothetical protein NPIL_507131 [Nephila pilipes]|uniref:Uncharacterized protein n=1 Tax=Nephila pilipes TaxID=299642 RepID=A0A8X6QTL5_NEPPI|nr:hypothetical protein NPIL_507131 [Nephila pilipes]
MPNAEFKTLRRHNLTMARIITSDKTVLAGYFLPARLSNAKYAPDEVSTGPKDEKLLSAFVAKFKRSQSPSWERGEGSEQYFF